VLYLKATAERSGSTEKAKELCADLRAVGAKGAENYQVLIEKVEDGGGWGVASGIFKI